MTVSHRLNTHPADTSRQATEGIRPGSQRRPRGPEGVGEFRAGTYLRLKAAAEYAIALALFILSLPLFAVAALAVKLTSRGPVFYGQTRVGRFGRPFTIYKVRSMVHDCEALTGPRWSLPGDPRITTVGRILRKTHLDELPQLVNVLKGEMALVGPRPERPEFVEELEQQLPTYRDRLLVRPGITGLAQVQLPPDTGLVSVRRKLTYDLYYIRRLHWSLDLRVLLGTAFKAVGVPYRLLRRLSGLPRSHTISREMRRPGTTAPAVRTRRAA
jgi:lipopolysaccharide/colanic/teichoic acid biosynthesis glycosyltransferase